MSDLNFYLKKFILIVYNSFLNFFLNIKNYIFNNNFVLGYYNVKNPNFISHNFFEFCLFLELKRQEFNKKYIKLYFTDGNQNTFPNNFRSTDSDILSNRYRLFNLCLPSLKIFSKISSFNFINNKSYNNFFLSFFNSYASNPEKNQIYLFNNFNKFLKSPFSFESSDHKIVSDWCMLKNINIDRLVTITIRSSLNNSEKNSNIEEWIKFYKYLQLIKYHPVFILDCETHYTLKEIQGLNCCDIASNNLNIRYSFYNFSLLNCFVSNGPPFINLFLDNNFIYFHTYSKSWINDLIKNALNFKSFNEKKVFKKIICGDKNDTFNNMKSNFELFLEFLK